MTDNDIITIGSTYFYGDESELSLVQTKVVKTRKEHTCCACWKPIPKGERVFFQKALVDHSFFGEYRIGQSCCLLKWQKDFE